MFKFVTYLKKKSKMYGFLSRLTNHSVWSELRIVPVALLSQNDNFRNFKTEQVTPINTVTF